MSKLKYGDKVKWSGSAFTLKCGVFMRIVEPGLAEVKDNVTPQRYKIPTRLLRKNKTSSGFKKRKIK